MLRIAASIALPTLLASLPLAGHAAGGSASNCVQLAALDVPGAASGKPATPRGDGQDRRRVRAPITESEILSLIGALEPIGKVKGEFQIKAMVEKSSLRLERAQFMLGDVAGLLATLQAKDTIALVRGSRDLPARQSEWIAGAIGAIPGCMRGSFADRGGEPAFAESLKIVEKHRRDLERVIAPMTGHLPDMVRPVK